MLLRAPPFVKGGHNTVDLSSIWSSHQVTGLKDQER